MAERSEVGRSAETGAVATVAAVIGLTLIYAPVLLGMISEWSGNSTHSHGFLIAPLALYFAWERRPQLARVPHNGSWLGLLLLLLGCAALGIGRLGAAVIAIRVSFLLSLAGLVLLLLGRPAFRILRFPIAFSALMVPIPGSMLNVVAFPLQLFAAELAVGILQWFDLPVYREGNILHLPGLPLFVAEACSGLRSLMALISLGIVFAYFFRKGSAERVILVLSTIPIAILVNALRVALTSALALQIGSNATEGWFHEFQGIVTFGGALTLLTTEAWLLQRVWPRSKREPARPPPS